jgi:hypothetical protein
MQRYINANAVSISVLVNTIAGGEKYEMFSARA